MKKLFVLGLTLMTSSIFANEIVEKNLDTTACCTRTSSSGEVGTPGYISVTVTKCYGGATRNDALVAACHNASAAAAAAVKSLQDTTVTIYPTN